MTKKTTPTKPEDMVVKVNMSVADRFNLSTILPPSGSLSEMNLSEQLVKRVELTDVEKKAIGAIALPDGRWIWEKEKAKLREFRFEKFEILLIQQGIRRHDERKTLQPFNHELARRLLNINVK